ncbi:UvrD-helicase domain-containing protein [Candidatus Uhrbacteria bacterium]|nr:UvrD-helicase domain-containing protein [Candidatus Uhrbacteria bacterium]
MASPTSSSASPPLVAPAAHPLLVDLNDAQRAAVTHGDGPLLIVAGAGTGKTTVITRRIAWQILERGVSPDGILALTFTEKAATEMEERIDRLLPYGYVDLWVSTFHSFCERILQRHALDIGLPSEYRLIDTTAAWLLMRQNLDQFPLDYYRPRGNPAKFLHALHNHFSRCKDEAITPEEYLKYATALQLDADVFDHATPVGAEEDAGTERARVLEVANAYHAYQRLLRTHGCLDFGDLLVECLRLFRERPAILARYRQQFRCVLVDEFQDTNWAQYELVQLLAGPAGNLNVVGDDDQSIYAFRGAAMSNILHFQKDYPQAVRVAITTNYRSRQSILDAAYTSIQQNNPARLEVSLGLAKRLVAANMGTGAVDVLPATDAVAEAQQVVEKILALRQQDDAGEQRSSWNDFAILVRANRQAEQFLPALDAAGIPYLFHASRGLYRKPIILDILAYLTLLDDYHESPALYRILNLPAFEFTVEEILSCTTYAQRKALSLHEVLRQARTVPGVVEATATKIDRLLQLLAKHVELARRTRVREVVLAFLEESGELERLTRVEDADGHEAVRHLNEFWKRIESFEAGTDEPTVKRFREVVDLEREAGDDGALPMDPNDGPEAVHVLTVHAAKGLEFRYVFIVNCIEQRFPATDRSEPIPLPPALTRVIVPEGDMHLQEERRLFYVALTRAKEGVFLTYAEDYGGARSRKPSRFLGEIGFTAPGGPRRRGSDRATMLALQSARSGAHADAAPTHVIPAKLSFTQLKAYRTCPWQYHYAHVLRIPLRGRWTLSFGQTMHLTLQRFFERLREQGSAAQGALFGGGASEAPRVPSVEELLDLYRAAWIEDWYQSRKQHDEYRANGERILKEFHAKHAAAGWPIVQALEQPFTVKFDAFSVLGKADRIDVVDGGVEIVDYKTGSPRERLDPEDKMQLLIYQVAATQALGVTPKVLSYYYLETNEKVSFLGTDEELGELADTVIEVGNRIARGEFKEKPGLHCRTCDFKNICPYAQS